MVYTVKKLARLAGVSVRTLHYYDQIGLLHPSSLGENGYRYYADSALLRLQQVLFYREMEFSLEMIKNLLNSADFDVLTALQSHKKSLQGRVKRLERLLLTVDETIERVKGNANMDDKGLFEGFSEEQQEKFAKEAEQLYDPQVVRDSNRRWKAYPQEEKERILNEGKTIYLEMAACMPAGASSPQAQTLVARWHKNMEYFWIPNDEQLLGLASGYNTDARFKANFDKIHPNLAAFMLQAVTVYVENRKK
jgi:MerR family transcriptional regulator, thiopeptide resistance regulator